MATDFRFACGPRPRKNEQSLKIHGTAANITLHTDQFLERLGGAVAPRVRDLIEIAAYVSAADQMATRGDPSGRDVGAAWRRSFHLRVAVRDLKCWKDRETHDRLQDVLAFVSDDAFTFEFQPTHERLTRAEPWQKVGELLKVDRVIAFSGGLDSFSGAAESLLGEGRPVALVTVGSSTKLAPVQATLVRALNLAAADQKIAARAHPFPLWFQRQQAIDDEERTQRTRSFLVAAAGAAAASTLGVDELHFYENGIISLNLPLSAQTVGARATRTTHPATLQGYASLLSKILEFPFGVINPSLWRTKADVIRKIAQLGLSDAIRKTISCGSVITMKRNAPHCGLCSQCIDRRIAILAAGLAEFDPADGYRKDVFSATRDVVHLTLAEGYYRRAREIAKLDQRAFVMRYPELARIVSHLDGPAGVAAGRVYELHRRHSDEVLAGIAHAVRAAASVPGHALPAESSLLALAHGEGQVPTGAVASASVARDVVTIVHVSDIHFSAKSTQEDLVLNALARDVRDLRTRRDINPDLLIVTGDVVDRGSVGEFTRAERWLGEHLLPATGLPAERVVLVPGNHDVDRRAVSAGLRTLRAGLLEKRDQELLTELFEDADQRRLVFRPLGGFTSFAAKFEARRQGSDAPWTRAPFEIGGRRVHVAGLSTACFAYDRDDQGKLVIGLHQVLEVLDTSREADLVVGAFHHPLSHVADFDARVVTPHLRSHCHLVLTGHVHGQDGVLEHRPEEQWVLVTGGTAFAGTTNPNRYHIIEWDFGQQQVRIRTRYWTGVRWDQDNNAFGGRGSNGVTSIPMPIKGAARCA